MKEDVKKYLGLKVRAIREAAGMTQEELAATCDVSWRTISNLERGTVVPDLVMIYKISQEFNISIDEMLDNKIAEVGELPKWVRLSNLVPVCFSKSLIIMPRLEAFMLFSSAARLMDLQRIIS